MDEATSTSSSSAAAVADGASTAAGSKTMAPASATAASHVKLLIKASNQQFEDQIIESDLTWTVKRLKTQLSLVYPGKPAVSDQKLIYSGQLLNDSLQLKDVIRSYKDVYTHNHIFHLVYTPKNVPLPALSQKPKPASGLNTLTLNETLNEGLRQRRHVGTNLQSQQVPTYSQPQCIPPIMTAVPPTTSAASQMGQCPDGDPNRAMPFSFPGQYNMQALATQQAAMYNWMQQVYSQYMDQCVRLSNSVAELNGSGGGIGRAEGSAAVPPNPFLQQLPFSPNPSNNIFPVISTLTQGQPDQSSDATSGGDQQPLSPLVVPQQQQQQQQQQQEEQQQPQQAQVQAVEARFPNIVQDEQDNHDWLESFFSITRLALFLTILYFNSSPLRCLVVVVIAGGIYMYHVGVFRMRHERNNNNINRNNNAAAAAAAVDEIRHGVQQVQEAQAVQQQRERQQNAAEGEAVPATDAGNGGERPLSASSSSGAESQAVADTEELGNNSIISAMSFLRTFVVTFFTSLLPETPAL